eukprot:Sspe_Gene.86685::Locus_57427_Transcript_1_1_Confidence_1.000_Length_2476::g.86685::m.86685
MDHEWELAETSGKYPLTSDGQFEIHGRERTRSELRVLNSLWPYGEYSNFEQMKITRERSLVEFVNNKSGKRLKLLLRRPRPEDVYIPQIRIEGYRSEEALVSCFAELVESLKRVEEDPNACIPAGNPAFLSKNHEIYVTVHNILSSVGMRKEGNEFCMEDDVTEAHKELVTNMRTAIEEELGRLETTSRADARPPWEPGYLTSYMDVYADNVLLEISTQRFLLEGDVQEVRENFPKIKRIWEWSAAYWYYEFYSRISGYLDNAQMVFDAATSLLCDAAVALSIDEEKVEERDPPITPEIPPWDSSDIPSEPSRGWGLRTLGIPNPAKKKRRDTNDPVVLLNTGNSCWLNSVLLPLYHVPSFRSLLFSITPFRPEWEKQEHNDVTQSAAMRFVHRLQALMAFMGPLTNHKYIFSMYVKESFESYHRSHRRETSGADPFGGGNSDASEFLTALPELLEGAVDSGKDDTQPEAQEAMKEAIASLFYINTTSHLVYPRPDTAVSEQSDGPRKLFPIVVNPRGHQPLPVTLMRAMETGVHSFSTIQTAPQLLVVLVNRRLWDAQQGVAYFSSDPLPVPTTLCLDALTDTEENIETRRALLRLEHEMHELSQFNPLELWQVRCMLPKVVYDQLPPSSIQEMQNTLSQLRHHAEALEGIREGQMTRARDEHMGVTQRLLEKLSAQGTLQYSLCGTVVFGSIHGGHYWCHIRGTQPDHWMRCDDIAIGSTNSLPDFQPYTTEKMLEEANTMATCLFYVREGENAADLKIPDHLCQRVREANERLEARLRRLSEQTNPADLPSSEEI